MANLLNPTVRQREPAYKNRKWLAAVGSIENCVLCGCQREQVAHRNEGKGMGMKTDDCLTAALCRRCHDMIDNGKELSRDERRSMMDSAIVKTVKILVISGKLAVNS